MRVAADNSQGLPPRLRACTHPPGRAPCSCRRGSASAAAAGTRRACPGAPQARGRPGAPPRLAATPGRGARAWRCPRPAAGTSARALAGASAGRFVHLAGGCLSRSYGLGGVSPASHRRLVGRVRAWTAPGHLLLGICACARWDVGLGLGPLFMPEPVSADGWAARPLILRSLELPFFTSTAA